MAGRGTTATIALERAGIPFMVHEYAHDPRHESYGREASEALGVSPDRVFKTLIAEVDGILVAGVVPVDGQLDLKALAAAAGGKKAAMAQVTAAERATGYVAGGISPVGQRKRLPVVLDASAMSFATVFCSGGRRGLEIELAPADLVRAADAKVASIGRPGILRSQAVRRRNSQPETATETARMPPHQASAVPSGSPPGWRSSRPRMVSVTDVAGWCSAKPRSHHGIVLTGTNALLA